MAELEEVIGANIRRLREARGMTQTDMARAVPALRSRQSACVAEQGGRAFVAAELVALAELFGVTIDSLVRPPECKTCLEMPPPGFTCNICGRTSKLVPTDDL